MSNCCLKALVLSVVSKLLRNFFLKHIFHSHPRGMRSSSSEVRPSHICVSISQVDSNTKSSNHDRAEEIGLSLPCTRKISANRGSRYVRQVTTHGLLPPGGAGTWGAVILPFNAFGAHILGHSTLSGDEQMKEPLSNTDT